MTPVLQPATIKQPQLRVHLTHRELACPSAEQVVLCWILFPFRFRKLTADQVISYLTSSWSGPDSMLLLRCECNP